MKSEPQWSDLEKKGIEELETTFKSCPHCFFSEHDIHSSLYSIIKKQLKQLGIDSQISRDSYKTNLVHHEYPTPFRCDMRKYNFRVTSDQERTQRDGLYKRGHYDLVIFNPEFIKNHTLEVVHGKNYQKLRSILPKLRMEPLIWACGIIYFPKIEKLPKNALKIVEQDTLKVRVTLGYKIMNNRTFCKIGSVHVFISHPHKEATHLEQQTAQLAERQQIEITFTTARD